MSAPVTNPAPESRTVTSIDADARARRASMPDDGTRQLLQGAGATLVAGILAAIATKFLFGGIGVHGPHTNAGWISLMVTMMCLPFGVMLLVLGGAKYLRNRRLARKDTE